MLRKMLGLIVLSILSVVLAACVSPSPVERIVEVQVPVEVERIVEVEKIVEVERIVEVEKIVEVEVPVQVPDPQILVSIERGMEDIDFEAADYLVCYGFWGLYTQMDIYLGESPEGLELLTARFFSQADDGYCDLLSGPFIYDYWRESWDSQFDEDTYGFIVLIHNIKFDRTP